MSDEIERIAEGLSEAQQDFIIEGGGDHETALSKPVFDLWFVLNKMGKAYFTVALNSTGKAVRTHLQEQSK